MKKTKKFRLFTVLIALCMLVGTIPAYAVNPYGSLTLTFTSEEDIDLGGIEISVYQAAPATVTETYTLYNETFHSTVTTNQNGSVTFAKPSQYCSVTVELDSLPDGVGITKQTKFFNPDVTEQTIILATVDRAETELSGTEVKPTFYSADNVQLLADYEVVMSDNAYATMPWESIDAMDSFTLSGAFVDGNMSVPYSIPLDVSQTNIWDKYEMLNEYGLITEKVKIVKQSEAIIDPQNKSLFNFQTISALENYRNTTIAEKQIINLKEVATHQSASSATAELSLINEALKLGEETLSVTSDSIPTLKENAVAIVKSSLNKSDIEIVAQNIATELIEIHRYFVTMIDFRSPPSSDGKVTVIIIDDPSENAGLGGTTGATIQINYSKMVIDGIDLWKTVLAHEYQHAIQNAYATGYKDTWLSESTANFASAMYAQHAFYSSYEYRTYFIYDHLSSIKDYHN